MKTIGLIDDFIIIRLGLALVLNNTFSDLELLEAESLDEFENLYPGKRPELIIHGNNSTNRQECINLAARIKEQYPTIPLIVYDDHPKLNLAIPYFEAGVNGYILKQNIAEEIVPAVKAMRNNRLFLCQDMIENLLMYIAKKQHQLSSPSLLTPRESEIARYLTQGMKTSWIAKTLGRKPSTISTIKHNIFEKMKVENIVELKKVFLEG
ncbi:response regulator transcription factor [Dyadobacter tibetensis]|uniref:response regulator transcription factor n=1 Tax=Dyadobacter tibetensis TaxID=1211851 RepID=UPI000470C399|nr:response regulator transcription factor [Dyadobacter tibetensis]